MALTRTDETELLTALYAANLQHDGRWRPFLSRLRARIGADTCRLSLRAAGDPTWLTFESARPGADGGPPAPPSIEAMRAGRVYAGDEVSDVQAGSARHLRIVVPEGGDALLSARQRPGHFTAADSSLLASLEPHLGIALRTHAALERERRRARTGERLAAYFTSGWLLLDARGRILAGDAAAHRLVARGAVLRRASDGRLRCLHPAAEALLEGICAEPAPHATRAEWLSLDPPIQMAVVSASEPATALLPAAHCLMVLRDLTGGDLGGGRHLAALFRLNRSEAALAAELATDTGIADAAGKLGFTIETARNYSKRLYVKMRAHGQADVVRLVLNGVSLIG